MKSTLFYIFGFPVRSYGLMMVIGFALGMWRAARVGEKQGISKERIYDMALIALISGIIGSRLVYVLLNLETESFSKLFAVWEGGLSFHGGVIFAVISVLFYTRKFKMSFLKCADILSPSLAIGYAFTRIGCFLNGCCYGCPTNLPWGICFNENGIMTPPSHPTQIYASMANIVIFLLLARLEKKQLKNGMIFTYYLGFYGVYRFLIEYLRAGSSAKLLAFGFTQAQVVSLLMIIVSFTIIATRRKG